MAKPSEFPKRKSARLGDAVVAACCAMVPWIAGCRAVDHAQADVMERELRQQEDYIYELEDYLIEYSEKLRQCRMACQGTMEVTPSTDRRSTPTGEPTLADDAPRGASSRRPSGRAGAGPIVVPPDESAAGDPSDSLPGPGAEAEPPVEPAPISPEEMEAPELDLGPTSGLQWQEAAPVATSPAPASEVPTDEAPPFMPDPADYQFDVDAPAAVDGIAETSTGDASLALAAPELSPAEPELPPPADPARLTPSRLEIRRLFAEPPAPEAGPEAPAAGSLLVVVEALNATDEPVDAGSEISLMIMAGETPQTLERVDRWNFTLEETQASWQSSHLGDGLHLELPLGQGPLPEGPLELWARVVNADGTKLLARLPFAADKLTSIADAPADAVAPVEPMPLTTSDAPEPTPESSTGPAADAPPPTIWRASSEPLSASRVEGFASTTSGQSGGWTRQPPGGRAPLTPVPRVASGPPRWQHGTTEPVEGTSEPTGAWAPFR